MKSKKILLIILVIVGLLIGCSKNENHLVGYWSFDEGAGQTLKEKVSDTEIPITYVFNKENEPFLYKEPSDPLWNENGIAGNALLFDGYSTYIEQEAFKIPSEEFTVSVWVAPRAFEWGDGGKLSAFISQANKEKKEGLVFGMYRHGTWGLQFGVGNDLLSEWVEIWDNGNPLPKYEWSYLVATYSAKEGKASLFLNGELINEVVFENYIGHSIRTTSENLFIGKHNNNEKVAGVFDVNMFNGMMDELKIHDKAFTLEEVQSSYNEYLKMHGGKHPEIDYDTLKIDPSIYAGDRYRPQYHAIPPGHWMNEPHAPIYYNGKYHLFYQHNPFGPFWHQIHWGHWVSDDMVNWEYVQEALSPFAGELAPDGMWSGSATYDKDGKPVLFVTAGNDSANPNQRVGLFFPKDLNDPYLTEWEAYPTPVAVQEKGQGDFGEFRDPFVWKAADKDLWYMLVGSGTNNGNGGTALIYTSTNLIDWEYHGNVFESDYNKYTFLGEHWELPVLLPVQSKDGSIQKHIFLISPHGHGADVEVYYWLGEFNEEELRFIPEHEEPRIIDYGDGVFTGPSGFVDPKTGRTILFTITQGIDRNSWEDYYSGWAHNAGLPLSLFLDDTNGELRIEPIEEIENARKKTLFDLQNNLSISEINESIKDIKGDLLQIKLEIENKSANKFGIQVRKELSGLEYTSIYYDNQEETLVLDRLNSSIEKTGLGIQKAPLKLENNILNLIIFLDRSQLEIYGNEKVSITSRIYPTLADSMHLELFTDGDVIIRSIEINEMGSVYSDEVTPPYYQQ